MIGLTIDAIEVGDVAEIARRASDADIAAFVESVGDYNPVHSDPEYAAATQFEEPIAPGIWTAGLISAVDRDAAARAGRHLPVTGPQVPPAGEARRRDSRARRGPRDEPVKNRMRLRTVCTNQRGEDVLAGEALVMPSRTPVVYERPAEPASAVALWALNPWAWAAQPRRCG